MFTKITYLKNAVSYVEAEGKLDIYAAPDYLEQIKEHLKNRYTKELVLEFSKITFVASIGLRTILELHKIMQEKRGILKLKNVTKEVLYSFEITGFDKFLIIENDSEKTEKKEEPETDYDINKPEISSAYDVVDSIVRVELSTILRGLNKWYDQTAAIIGCHESGRSIESTIVQILLQDDKSFNETLNNYEKVTNDEYIDDVTNKHIPLDKEIQILFGKLILKLREIRAKITVQ